MIARVPAPATIADPAALAAHCAALISGREVAPRDMRFGPSVIRVRFHGFSARTRYDDALAPASASDDPPLFAIDVIDGSACGIGRPRLDWKQADFGAKRIVPGWSDARRTTYLLRSEGGFALADWTARRAVIWLPSAEAVPWYERAAPFRWLFDALAARQGMAMLHAAAIGLRGRGVLLAGRGGAGKSTLALACLGRGFDYVADDYCLLSATPQPTAYGLYRTAKWKKDALVVPGWLAAQPPHALDDTQQKNVVRIDLLKPGQLADRLTITAIVMPVIADVPEARLDAITGSSALGPLAASTLAQAELDDPRPIALMGRLARAVPAYRLRMPRDPERSVSAIEAWLAQGEDRA